MSLFCNKLVIEHAEIDYLMLHPDGQLADHQYFEVLEGFYGYRGNFGLFIDDMLVIDGYR